MSERLYAFALIAVAMVGGCRTGRDYTDPLSQRYAGGPATTEPRSTNLLRIVSFNIEFARRIDEAIDLLATDPALRDADLILLQEMDGPGTDRIARALRMRYVFYPAIYHRRTRRDFGNAVLSRWPIVADAKVVLPHASRYAGTHRTATAVTLRVGTSLVRVYSTHLGTPADIGAARRRGQLRAILADASPYRFVIIGGDLNDSRVGLVASESGYQWPTRHGPRTNRFGRWDHIFLKGLRSPEKESSGTSTKRRVSDHYPVWTTAVIPSDSEGPTPVRR